jgi:hypothetical protein
MARYKLNDADENFLKIPLDAQVIFAGAGGTETWIERDRDSVVRIEVKAIAVATADGGTLQACIQIGEDCAKGEDGPFPADGQLRASQSVQILVKGGERLAFKAYPNATNAKVMRTIVWAADLKIQPEAEGGKADEDRGPSAPETERPQPSAA